MKTSIPMRSLWLGGALALIGPGAARSQPPPADRPVEQVRKNIQVLKGLPASELFPLMNLIKRSVGADTCEYCHVNRGGDDWVWESDDKATKRTARQMMSMTMSLNTTQRDLFGADGVTCYTCHAGERKPVSLAALTPSQTPPSRPSSAIWPVVKSVRVADILAAYRRAVGADAQSAMLTRRLTGSREASGNRVWPLEVVTAPGNKYLVTLEVPGQGTVRQGLDGRNGWVESTTGTTRLDDGAAMRLRNDLRIYDVVKTAAAQESSTFLGVATVLGREAHVIEWHPAPTTTERLYFDAETSLLLRQVTLTPTVLSPLPEQIDFEDYRRTDGLFLPHLIRITNVDDYFSSVRRLTRVEHGIAVDEQRFAVPKESR